MSKLSDFIDTLDLPVDGTYRGECPVCLGKNTFTVTNEMGNLLYNCYKAGCDVHGAKHTNMDVYTIRSLLNQEHDHEGGFEQDLCTYSLPPYIVPYDTVEHPIDPMFLRRYGINPIDVMYDIRQDRLVFPVVTESGELVDAVGRSLKGQQPKWLRYAASPVPYVHGSDSNVAVIVEDAISAYVVGEMFGDMCTGVALLGTQLTAYHKEYIHKYYPNVIVALDPDAQDKTIAIARELDGMALKLSDDLKYASKEDVDNLAEMLYAKQ